MFLTKLIKFCNNLFIAFNWQLKSIFNMYDSILVFYYLFSLCGCGFILIKMIYLNFFYKYILIKSKIAFCFKLISLLIFRYANWISGVLSYPNLRLKIFYGRINVLIFFLTFCTTFSLIFFISLFLEEGEGRKKRKLNNNTIQKLAKSYYSFIQFTL